MTRLSLTLPTMPAMQRNQTKALNAVMTLLGNSSPRQKLVAGLSLVALLLGFLFGQPSDGNTVAGRVTKVADGDTVTVVDSALQEHKIRMAFIDAPEKAQPHGAQAKEQLSSLVFGQSVEVEVIEKDRYGRTVGRVLRAGHDVNLAMIQAGYAWHYTQYAKKQGSSNFSAYQNAEAQARQSHTGLWQDAEPQAPWEYRSRKRQAQ